VRPAGSTNPRPSGALLAELEYLTEAEAAVELGLKDTQTLIKYRKKGIGPAHIVLARRVLYARPALVEWLAAGGTKDAER
jgi:hypothetical protein